MFRIKIATYKLIYEILQKKSANTHKYTLMYTKYPDLLIALSTKVYI